MRNIFYQHIPQLSYFFVRTVLSSNKIYNPFEVAQPRVDTLPVGIEELLSYRPTEWFCGKVHILVRKNSQGFELKMLLYVIVRKYYLCSFFLS